MVKVERSIVINAPVERVFIYIDDATSKAEWLLGIMEVKDVTLPEQRVGSYFR